MSDATGHIELERAVDSISIGVRHRTNPEEDLAPLMRSIERLGLLQPVTITPDGVLICGQRRLEAVKRLGWRTLRVWVRVGLSDDLTRLLAEQDENAMHKPLSPLDAAAPSPGRGVPFAGLRAWWTMLVICLEERLAYRGDFVLGTLMRFLPIVTQIFLWTAVYQAVSQNPALPNTVAGYTRPEIIAYYLLAMVGRAFSSMPGLASSRCATISSNCRRTSSATRASESKVAACDRS